MAGCYVPIYTAGAILVHSEGFPYMDSINKDSSSSAA